MADIIVSPQVNVQAPDETHSLLCQLPGLFVLEIGEMPKVSLQRESELNATHLGVPQELHDPTLVR